MKAMSKWRSIIIHPKTFQVKLDRLFKVGLGCLDCLPLAHHAQFHIMGHVPIFFLGDYGCNPHWSPLQNSLPINGWVVLTNPPASPKQQEICPDGYILGGSDNSGSAGLSERLRRKTSSLLVDHTTLSGFSVPTLNRSES